MLCQSKMEELTEKKTWFTSTQAVTNITCVLLKAWRQRSVGSFEQPLKGLLMMLKREPRMVTLAVNRCRMSHLLRC